MLRRVLLGMSRSPQMKKAVSSLRCPAASSRGSSRASPRRRPCWPPRSWSSNGLYVTLDHLGEDVTDLAAATATADAYLELLRQLSDAGLTTDAEVSVKLSAVGQALPGDGEKIALENARTICHAARNAGTTVTLDMEDHTTTDSTLASCASCARTSRGPVRCCRRTCAVPRRTAGTSPTRAPGCGSARARTRSRESVAFQDKRRGGQVVRALHEDADGRAPATRWSPPTTRG